ncbi:MAG: cohesin domain-containing protein, partial [Candidatus Poribacteria bacterium]
TVAPDGSSATRLTNTAVIDRNPDWSTFLPTDTAVTVLDAQGQAGASVTIPVQITDTTGLVVTGLSLGITYDAAALTPTGATPAAAGALVPVGWSVEQNVPAAGLLQVSLAGGFGDPLVGAGVLLDVTFDVAAGATAGATSALTLSQADLNEGVVSSSHIAGTFTVLSLTYGDVTGNGDVTSFDASWVLEYVVTDAVGSPITFPIETAAPTWATAPLSNADAVSVADVSGDAGVGAIDASLILQHDVELITQFPVEAPAAPAYEPVAVGYRLSGVSSSTRPGGRIVVTLDAADVADLLAGELRLDFDPVAMRPVSVSVGGSSQGPAPMLAHHTGAGQVGVAFASARPIEPGSSLLTVVFETARDLDGLRSGVIEATRLRLNGSTVEPNFRFAYSIEPFRFQALANYPNPFNPETWIPFELNEDSDVTIHIYSLDGQRVRTLEVGSRAMGVHSGRDAAAYWNGKNAFGEAVSSGVYTYELIAGSQRATRRMVVLK